MAVKVSELNYERVTIEEFTREMEAVIRQVKEAQTAADVLAARDRCNALSVRWQTAEALSYMRYSINTVDEFYVAEKDYYDEVGPLAQNEMLAYTKAMLDTPFRKELEDSGAIIPLVFRSFEVELKSMSPEIIEDMVEENKLVSRYSQLMAAMEFDFRGEKLPRPMLMKYAKSPDRATRKEAYEVLGNTLKVHSADLDEIFDQMVKVRDRMAKKMGCKNFVELGYYRMGRLCYGPEEVKAFRENIRKDVVPVVARLRTEIGKKLGVDRLMVYDYDLIFPQGDPAPKGGKEAIFAAARAMYHDMSPETGRFFDFMLETEAFDVESRKHKWGGGYCQLQRHRRGRGRGDPRGRPRLCRLHHRGQQVRGGAERGRHGDRRDPLHEHGVLRLALYGGLLRGGRPALPVHAPAGRPVLPALRDHRGRLPAAGL